MPPQIVHHLQKDIKIACVQFASTKNKENNIQEAERLVKLAAHNGAHLIVLPECFNSPYSTACFPKYAEVLHPSPPSKETSPTFHALSRMAMDSQAFIVSGSIPELETESRNLYNTSLVFAPTGQLVGFHRKAHLFDVDFPGRMSFRESDVLSPGNAITVINLNGIGKIGLGICFDVRFPEMAAIAAREGAFALIYPSAFNTTTGPLHWEVLARARALDNQVFVAMCSQSFEPGSDYPAWGYSMVVDPSGQIMSCAGTKEAIVYADLADSLISDCRKQIPLTGQRRFDLYDDVTRVEKA
ncbi:hypothetical protein G7054_g1172 [Neopestalotiopsis clavispora]|nr:hypothetical protein G7054_g1172 [Neopestalotiopsis clavispora]